MLAALAAGAVAALGVHYTHRSHKLSQRQFEQTQDQFKLAQDQFAHTQTKDRQQAEQTREGQVTERYVEAIKLLGSSNATERLGGIYSLERIMRDSAKDHDTVVEVLSSFVRLHAPAPLKSTCEELDSKPRVDEHVQAAITVLGRRPVRDEGERRIDLRRTDLRGADMEMLRFDRALLDNAFLDRASLEGASFCEARLHHASIRGALLCSIDFTRAGMTGVRLNGSRLWNSDFSSAMLVMADLTDADLTDAEFGGANMDRALLECAVLFDVFEDRDARFVYQVDGLQVSQIAEALVYETTRLPPEFAGDPRIKARIVECEAERAERVRS
ncbi:pentapeptide repeat-containing protein [Streptomyces inhibens]|uniref:pentapeptide repeat-containing protein n=1 Tax=Streptomyces inhibens TaxID=2293571 RepID=UPI001EE77256|nr:pentapeptide repeat-containing protein [Streptomyces inhibens]UKY48908.1 pentapeptide repeat-containing protein [Streptomyces inhibens]